MSLQSEIQSKTLQENNDLLSELVDFLEKEVKQERENLYRVLLCGLSSITANPINMRILAPTSEGKSYLLEKVSNLFPEKNMIKLSSASAKSFKYSHGKLVIENGGKYVDLDEKIKPLQSKLKDSSDNEEKEKIKSEIKSLKSQASQLIDLENKWLIFMDSQDPNLWDFLKSLLSHDSEYIKHNVTNKIGGSNKLQKVVFKGKPAVIYASAKDESKRDLTSEIDTRFQTISLKANSQKYKQSIDLLGKKHGLGPIYEEEVTSEEEFQEAKNSILRLIENLKKFGKSKAPIINLFSKKMSEIFPSESGVRSREFSRLAQTITILTLCNANNRPKVVIKNNEYPVTYLSDIQKAVKIIQANLGLPHYKIQFFNDFAKPAIEELGTDVIIGAKEVSALPASEIMEYYKNKKDGINTDRKKILETFLIPLTHYGFLERDRDPNLRTRDIFWISPQYENKEAPMESTLIDVSAFDRTCVTSFLDKYFKRRLEENKLYIIDTNGSRITLDRLCEMTLSNDITPLENRFKN